MITNRIRIDLSSDTATRPSRGMREAMAAAEVGDEQHGEDPSVNALCERVAGLLAKEAALFLPSGTMCNQIAIAVHCRPGDEIIAAEGSHIIDYEGAGSAALAGTAIHAVQAEHGLFTREAFERAVRPASRKMPRSRLISFEQTHNRGGGRVWPLDQLREVARAARERGLAVHIDGARLMNACVASGVPARDYAAVADSVWLDLSKGLGCPVGGVLAGARDFIEEAWAWKHRLGGAMRQAGILAAAGLYALDHNVGRLADDHRNAARLADGLRAVAGVVLDPEVVQTNIVFIDVAGTGLPARAIAEELARRGIRIGVVGPTRFRAVTHLDVDADDIDETIAAFAAVVETLKTGSVHAA